MSLSRLLFKPKWQDKDPATRKAAIVAGSDDAELTAALPEIARRDEDAGVRLAALQRLGDYEAWRERSTGDVQGSVRNAARETYLTMLCSGTGAPPVARRVAELETLSEDEIERVATSAADVTLRREAITRVSKQTLIAQRAAADPDPTLRLQLLERVSDATLLERIAERTRKTDKAVSRRARERLQAARIGAGDASAIAAHAHALCERTEALMRMSPANAASVLAEIDTEWNILGNTVPASLAARFRGARTLVLKAGEPRPVLTQEAPLVVDAPASGPTEAEAVAAPPVVDEAAAHRARAERARQKALRTQLESAIKEFSAALEAGDSAVAHRLHAQFEEQRKQLREAAPELRAQLDSLQPRYAELKRWQHWSNNQRRRILCADIENLIETGVHPDAVATRVREAREEWRHMNAAEGLDDDAEAAAGIARRFHGVCARALRPTRAYFAKRKEVRQTHASEIDALVARATAIGDDSTDWKGIAELRTEASTALRALDNVDPRRRAQIAAQLKGVISRMAALAGAHESEVEAAKARLIAQATALSAGGNTNAARETRDLQKRWTALGNGRRSTDQKQWREFRAACDAVFGKLDETRKQREEATAAAQAQTQQLLDDYAALAQSDDAESAKKQLRELDARWQSAGSEDRTMLKRQRELRDAIALNLRNSERRKRLGRFAAALQKYAAVRQQESGGPAAVLDDLPTAVEFDAVLAARHAGDTIDTDEDTAREALVSLEFLAGLESPSEDRQLRMNHQVQRLSSRMREGARAEPERELAELLKSWFAQAPQKTDLEERFAIAAKAAIDSLP